MIYADEVVVSHTNGHEYLTFLGRHDDSADGSDDTLQQTPKMKTMYDDVEIVFIRYMAQLYVLAGTTEMKAGMSLLKKHDASAC